MKKRVLSLFMAFTLCFSMQPTMVFAEGTSVAAEQEVQSSESTTGVDATGGISGGDVSGGDTGTQNTEKDATVKAVQELIDALPDEVTAENAEAVGAQLAAIDKTMAALTKEQAAGLNMTRYENICEALNALVAVQYEHVGSHGFELPTGKTWEAINNADELRNASENGYYYLTAPITLDAEWTPVDGMVLCLNGKTITMEADKDVITVGKGYTFTLCDCTGNGKITHGDKTADEKYSGGGVNISQSSGSFYMYGGNITGNTAGGTGNSTHGGGVYVLFCNFYMYGGSISGNTADEGGGVCIGYNAKCTMSGGTIGGTEDDDANIDTNSSACGAGVFISPSAEFNMTGGTISGNTGSYGGGVYVGGTFTISNNAVITGHNVSGVYVADGGTFNMNGGTVSQNQKCGVHSYNGNINMTGGNISGNTGSFGGGVYLGNKAKFTMTGGSITGNNATGSQKCAGGMYVAGTMTVSGNVRIMDNWGGGELSGDVYVKGDNGIKSNLHLSTESNAVPTTITISGPLTGGAGCIGVSKLAGSMPTYGNPIKIVVSGSYTPTDDDIKCFIADADNRYQITKSDDNTTLYLDVKPHEQHPICGAACEDGGNHANLTDWTGVSTLDNTMQKGNYYLTDDVTLTAAWKPADGTALCLNGHSIKVDANDDAIIVSEDVNFTLTDCDGNGVITHNSGKKSSGVTVGGTFTMYGGIISGNAMETSGGGVIVNSTGTFTMCGGTISGNTAGTLGGGVCVGSGTFTMSGGTISDNQVTDGAMYGGGGVGVYYGGTFTMTGSAKISGNKAVNGGGVYVEQGTFTMDDGSIYGNTAKNNGGGVYNNGTFIMTNGTIGGVGSNPSNDAVNGGGVYVAGYGTFKMGGINKTPQVFGNYITGKGAGVYADGILELSGGVQILDNNGGDSSDIYLPGDKTIRITGKLINPKTIGITLENPPSVEGNNVVFAEGNNYQLTDDDTKAFFYNDDYNWETYTVQRDGKWLRMYRGEPHRHTVCDGSGCTDDSHGNVLFNALTYDETGKTLKYGGMMQSASNGYYLLTQGNWYLTGNLELDAPIKIAGDVNLCLNGYSIILKADGNVIEIGVSGDVNAAKLTLCDCKQNGTAAGYGHITHGTGDSGKYTGRGVKLCAENTVFTMYGGKICDNQIVAANSTGAGVDVPAKTYFNMYGGEISGNTFTGTYGMGGGVYTAGTTSIGGNAKIFDNQVNVSGGKGGGIFADDGAALYVSGNVQVTDNQDGYFDSQGGSNVYLKSAAIPISVKGQLGNGARIGVTLSDKACPEDGETVIIAQTVPDTGESGTGWIQTGNFVSDYSRFYKLNVSDDGMAAKLELHDHIWEARSSSPENILKERCTVGICNAVRGVLTLTASDEDYTGSPYNGAGWTVDDKWQLSTTDVEISYEKKSSSGKFTALTEAPTAWGDYRVKLTLDGASATKEFSIKPHNLIPSDFIFTPPENLNYDGQPKAATVTLPENKAGAAGTITVKYFDEKHNLIADADGNPAAGVTKAGTYTVEIDVTAGKSYNSVSNMSNPTEWTFTIGKRPVKITGITAKNKSYDGTTKATFDYSQVGFDGKLDGDTLTVELQGVFADKNAGKNKNITIAAVVLGGESASNYRIAEDSLPVLTADITPIELAVTNVTVADKTYDGTATATVTDVAFDGLVTGDTLISGTDYTVNGTFADGNAGYDKVATVTVKLADSVTNYTFKDGSTSTECKKGSCTIEKAVVTKPAPVELTIINGAAKIYRIALPSLPALEAPKDYGKSKYAMPQEVTGTTGYLYVAEVDDNSKELMLDVSNTGNVIGNIGTVTVAVVTDNYEDIILTFNIKASDKIPPQLEAGTLVLAPTEITYGEALGSITISGTMKADDTVVPGTFAWQAPDTVLDAGTHNNVAWKFTPADAQTYEEITGVANVKVNKAAQSGAVRMYNYTYNETPEMPKLTGRTGDSNATVTYYYSTAGGNSGGTEWKDIQPTTLNAGVYSMYAVIGETANYSGFTTPTVKFQVWEASPNYTGPAGQTAKYGQKLGEIILDNPAGNMPGTWSWHEPDTVLDQIGTSKHYAEFTPDDTNYKSVDFVEVEVTVEQGDGKNLATVELSQKYADTSDHTYTPDWSGLPAGQTWNYDCEYSVSSGSTATLTKKNVSAANGELTYAVSGGKAGDKITVTLKAQCNNYKDFTITLDITITKADSTGEPAYTKITTGGKTLADAGLTLTGSTLNPADGKLEWIDDAGNVLPGNTEVEANKIYKWRFTPTDDNYSILTGEAELYHAVYTITASAGAHGSISPSGAVEVVKGGSQTFVITADTGYEVESLTVDGTAVSAAASYTFENVTAAHTIAVTFKAARYWIIDGADSSWTQNTDGSLVIRGNGAFSKFLNVLVDGNVIDPANYTAREGSTIIELKADYLKTLSEGSHTFEIVWSDGSAGTGFTVARNTSGGNNNNSNNNNNSSNNNSNNSNNSSNNSSQSNGSSNAAAQTKDPNTGDTSHNMLWYILTVVSAVGLAGMFVIRNKKKERL